ncbi:MAG: VWA domain-containing protein [Pyrinomonadaceae bacterium]|nr:VWA domain-containing protein [Pyrinomonadaceae bacterium]
MKNSVRIFTFFSLIFALGLTISAQTPTPTPKVSDDDTTKTVEVHLPVTVFEKKEVKGKTQFVKGLTRGDFVVLEDGVPQEVTFFSDEKNNPSIYVGLLMDTSPSTAGKITFSKDTAKNFLYTALRLRKDKAAFMTFDNEVNLIQDFTDKQDLLSKAIDSIKKTGSQTALYDAIWQFTDEKLRNAPGRRVIVVITDGDDTFSRAELNDAIDIAQRTETTIFAISTKAGFAGSVPGVDAGTVNDKGDKDLVRLCEETGGRAYFTGDQLALERSFSMIREELTTQYVVTYKPANQNYDGKERKIEVRLTDAQKAKDYKMRFKNKYIARKDSIKQ